MEIKEVKATRILNPTSIDLGEYVINPYKGCALSCLYCYVKHNKVTSRETRPWGGYVDVRINADVLLQKELKNKKPKCVLLGSTTECFQPVERQYGITGRILDILNKNKIYYSILTRSPIICDYISLLKEGYCEHIYFTINSYDDKLKNILEPKSAEFDDRIKAINVLLGENIPVLPYFSPILPFVSDFRGIFSKFSRSNRVDFEGLNFNLGNISSIIDSVGKLYPSLKSKYEQMAKDPDVYNDIWSNIKKDIVREAIKAKKNHSVYIHGLRSYFENKYRR